MAGTQAPDEFAEAFLLQAGRAEPASGGNRPIATPEARSPVKAPATTRDHQLARGNVPVRTREDSAARATGRQAPLAVLMVLPAALVASLVATVVVGSSDRPFVVSVRPPAMTVVAPREPRSSDPSRPRARARRARVTPQPTGRRRRTRRTERPREPMPARPRAAAAISTPPMPPAHTVTPAADPQPRPADDPTAEFLP
jgi:hypothetical protein